MDLKKDGKVVEVAPHEEGGTFAIGGLPEASLNITYNYSWFFHKCLDEEKGLRWLYGQRAGDTIERLVKAVEELGTQQYKDYWAPTPGNAGHALSILLKWAREHPEAVWEGD